MWVNTIVLALLLAPVEASAADTYLCESSNSTGFVYDKHNNKWIATSVELHHKYILKRRYSSWTWVDFEDQNSAVYCKEPLAEFVSCNRIEDVRLDIKRLRFQIIYPLGYAWGPSAADGVDGPDSPSIQIGTCKAL
jgi:hypothetical protein